MATYATTIRIPRPIDVTFAHVSNFANAAEWDPRTYAAEKATPGPIGVGTRFVLRGGALRGDTLARLRIPARLAAMALPYDIVAYEPPTRFVLEGTSLFYRYDDDLRFEPDGEHATVLHYSARLAIRGPLGGIFDRLLQPVFQRIGDDATRDLADAVVAAT